MAGGKTTTIGGVTLNVQYMLIWAARLILTLIEVAIPEVDIPRSAGVLSLISLAIAKTYLVAWCRGHRMGDPPTLVLGAGAPFIFSGFLTVGPFPWPR